MYEPFLLLVLYLAGSVPIIAAVTWLICRGRWYAPLQITLLQFSIILIPATIGGSFVVGWYGGEWNASRFVGSMALSACFWPIALALVARGRSRRQQTRSSRSGDTL